ncbi:MAG: PAS domain S-box protein [Fimbriimonas sp.]
MSAEASLPQKPIWENPETRQVLDSMTEFFAAVDANYDIVFVNRALATASPRGYEGFVGHNVWEFWPNMRNPVVEEALGQAFRTGLPGRFDFLYEPAGVYIDVSVHPSGGYLLLYFRDVTAQMRERAERNERENTLREFLAALPHIAWSADIQGKPTFINQRWRDYTGVGDSDTQVVRTAIHPDDLPVIKEANRSLRVNGAALTYRIRLRRHDGEYRWHEIRAIPHVSPVDGRTQFIGTTTDIHGEHLSRQALEESERRLNALMDQSTVGIAHTDLTGRFTLVNDRQCDLLSRPRERLIGARMQEFTHPDDLPGNMELFHHLVRTGEGYTIEKRYVHPNGDFLWVRNHVSLVCDDQDQPIYVLAVCTDVTDRKRAEEERELLLADVEEERLRLREVLESIRDAFYAVDSDFRFTYVNRRAEELWKRRREDLVGRHLWAEFPGAVGSESYRMHLQVMGDRKAARFETISPVFDRWIDVSLYPDENGGLSCYFRDVTDRKTAEIALREGEERYRVLADSMPMIVWSAGADGVVDYYNARWYEFTGKSRESADAFGWEPIVHPDDLARISDEWRRSIETGEPYEAEFRYFDGNLGGYRWFLGRALAQKDEHGQVLRWYGSSTEIHDAKVKQEMLAFAGELAEAKRTLSDPQEILAIASRLLGERLGASRCAYAEVDVDAGTFTIVQDWSPQLPSTRGTFPIAAFGERIPASQYAGETLVLDDLQTELEGDPAAAGLAAMGIAALVCVPLVKKGRLVAMMAVHQAEPRAWRPEEVDLVEMVADRCWSSIERARAEGRVREAYAVLERKVQERTAELQAANEALQGFTYHVSHDLRAPLRAIVATSRMVQEDFGHTLPNEAQAMLRRQADSANKLGQLIDDLLRLSRLSRESLAVRPIDFSELCREAAMDAVESHPDTKVQVEVQEGLEADADPRLLKLAMTNLLENAVKYSPQGGTVRVGQRDDGAFFVSDEGIGIDPRYHERIFEPFQRLHRDEEFRGTGIGLSNVRQVITRHGGKVWVESALGQGSTFLFTLGR